MVGPECSCLNFGELAIASCCERRPTEISTDRLRSPHSFACCVDSIMPESLRRLPGKGPCRKRAPPRVTIDACGFARGSVPFPTGLILLNIVAVVILFVILDRGRLISPAYSRLNARDVAKLRAVATPPRTPLLPESGD